MLNILRSDFYKLKKSRAFLVCLLLCVAMGVLIVVAMQQVVRMMEQGAEFSLFENAGGAFAMSTLLSTDFHLIIMGVFTAIFVSSEFIYGPMKNTLSRGADRIKVIFSKFIVCGVATMALLFAFMLAGLISGTLFNGFDPGNIVTPFGLSGMVLCQMLLTLSFTTLFVFISVTLRSNGGAIALNIVAVTMVPTLLSALSIFIGDSFDLNNYWLGTAVSKLATVTPASEDILQGILIALGWGIASMLAGSILFKKLDVK